MSIGSARGHWVSFGQLVELVAEAKSPYVQATQSDADLWLTHHGEAGLQELALWLCPGSSSTDFQELSTSDLRCVVERGWQQKSWIDQAHASPSAPVAGVASAASHSYPTNVLRQKPSTVVGPCLAKAGWPDQSRVMHLSSRIFTQGDPEHRQAQTTYKDCP